jgi:hypothetical protein
MSVRHFKQGRFTSANDQEPFHGVQRRAKYKSVIYLAAVAPVHRAGLGSACGRAGSQQQKP